MATGPPGGWVSTWTYRCGSFAFGVAVASLFAVSPARAELPLDVSKFSNPSQLLSDNTAYAIIKAIGLAADHRPYEPATALGTSVGFDASIEATLVRLPDDFYPQLQAAGLSSAVGDSALKSVPVPRINVHKGLGPRIDVGASWIRYKQFKLMGADLKVVIYQPDYEEGTEGMTHALRLCYSKAEIGFVKTQTFTPQYLVSHKLDFADPYIGVGYPMVTGKITIPLGKHPLTGEEIRISKESKAYAIMAFLGVGLRIPPLGLKLTVEGAYNTQGAHTLGTKFGLNF